MKLVQSALARKFVKPWFCLEDYEVTDFVVHTVGRYLVLCMQTKHAQPRLLSASSPSSTTTIISMIPIIAFVLILSYIVGMY